MRQGGGVSNPVDEVPGMTAAVEARRQELGLTPDAFAAATGLTRTGASNVRRGERRDYQDKTITGVAVALRWKRDWYERLLRGDQPEPEDAGGMDPDIRAELDEIKDRLDALDRLLRDYLADGGDRR